MHLIKSSWCLRVVFFFSLFARRFISHLSSLFSDALWKITTLPVVDSEVSFVIGDDPGVALLTCFGICIGETRHTLMISV